MIKPVSEKTFKKVFKIRRSIRNWLLLPGSLFLMVAYTNCSAPEVTGSASNSSASGASCDDALIAQYRTSFHTFFRQGSTCMNCHIEGGVGLGIFASPDAESSFAAFSAAGLAKVEYMATNPAHKPPYTGPHNKPAIDGLSAQWVKNQAQHLECVSKSENGGISESFLTAAKRAPNVYAGPGSKQTITWELDQASDIDSTMSRGVPAKISVEIEVLYQKIDGKDVAKGYLISDPVMAMKDAKTQIVIEGLFFQINNRPITSQTTFTSLSRVISGTTPIPLMKAKASTLIEPISSADEFQLYIRRIVPTSGTDASPAPLTPILRLTDSATGLETHSRALETNAFILRDSAIVRWCLSESPTRPASTEAACASGATGAGTSNGWYLTRPTKFTFSAGDGAKILYLWVANERLKINESAAQSSIILDTTAPVAPVIGSISAGNTQVGNLSVSQANEADVTGWCVFEQNSIRGAPGKPALDNMCWSWTEDSTKPTTVGFKGGGTRDVWVFVRDKAGNVSAASNKVTATNSFGAVTFAQLTGASSDPRAILSSRCVTCHGQASGPGFSKLNLSNYTTAVESATSGLLVSRTNNPLSPMPNVNGGLMPQRDRDLLRLWTRPEEGQTPLP